MNALVPCVTGAVVTAAAYAVLTRTATSARWTRANFRGNPVTLLGGVAVATGLLAAAAVVAVAPETRRAGLAAVIVVIAAAVAGAYDDLRGDTATKGLAGHLRALARGRVTSGSLKILGVGLGALAAGLAHAGARPRALAEGVLIAGCANLLNLFDLRPGRALKVAALAAAPLAIATAGRPLAAGLLGTVAAALPRDLRERAMLGDTGANALGAMAGVALAVALRTPAALAAAIAVVVLLTALSERVSYSRVIARTPPLRWLDALGRRP